MAAGGPPDRPTPTAEETTTALARANRLVEHQKGQIASLTEGVAEITKGLAELAHRCERYWGEILYLRGRVEALVAAPADSLPKGPPKSSAPDLPRVFGNEDFDIVGRPDLIRRLVETAKATTADAPEFVFTEAISQLGAIPENRTLRGYSTADDLVGVHVGGGVWERKKPDDVAIQYVALLTPKLAQVAKIEGALRVGEMVPRALRSWAAGQGGNKIVDLAVNNADAHRGAVAAASGQMSSAGGAGGRGPAP